MAFGGLAGGLLAMTLGLIRYRNEKESPFFRIGTSPEVEFPTDDSPSPAFALVAPLSGDFVFNFAETMEGEMIDDAGVSTPLSELRQSGRATPSMTAQGRGPRHGEDSHRSGAALFGGGVRLAAGQAASGQQ
jgi:hypothetical protein